MLRTGQAGGRTVAVVLGALVGVLPGCGSAAEPEVLGTSVTSTTDGGSTPSSTEAEVRISATSIVRGEDDAAGAAGASRPTPAGSPSPTVVAGAGGKPDGGDASTTGTAPSAEVVAEVDRAIASGDLCGVYGSLGRIQVSGADVARLRGDVELVVERLVRARALVPADLDASWGELTDGLRRVVEALGAEGATTDDVAVVYQDGTFRAAMESTDDWMDTNCDR